MCVFRIELLQDGGIGEKPGWRLRGEQGRRQEREEKGRGGGGVAVH